ncbi:MAG: LL-diaminopimelate aminotransferase [Clostridiales bacterium]|nr:MAG: LL-diaminopimelate aminotransferase [Clostridiales bacterium]
MKIKINENYKNLKKSYLFSEIAKRIQAYSEENPSAKIIRLGIGDVTLPLTKSVTQAMTKAVAEMGARETFRGYAPDNGYDFLREAISRHYKRFGVDIPVEEISVSDGAKSDVGNITEIFGDNPVLIPDPVYPVYYDSNVMSGRRISFIRADETNGFLPMPEGLSGEGYIIYLCSPNNPTGAVYDHAGLKRWVDFAVSTGSLILYDSAYEAYIHGNFPHTIYEIEGARACAIEICSFSKTAGFTGTRCSWTVVPSELSAGGMSLREMWERRQATKFNGVPYVVQRGAEAALSDAGYAECMELVNYYMENAALIAGVLREKGLFFTGGTSSPYIWMRCPAGMDSWSFFDSLLHGIQVVGTPGAGFGECGEGYFRLTSFGSREATKEAVERLRGFLR